MAGGQKPRYRPAPLRHFQRTQWEIPSMSGRRLNAFTPFHLEFEPSRLAAHREMPVSCASIEVRILGCMGKGGVLILTMIGIDLGTTNSLVALLKGGHPMTLQNEMGEDLIPSAVAVAQDGTLLVGRAARDRLVTSPNSGQAFFKRDMGTNVAYHFGKRDWSPVECSALVLRELKRIAELRLGTAVESAVITVPAYFHDEQRQATMEAARIAGLRVERLLNEPTAAALAYGFRADSSLSTLLIFDLGGGTFDVTVLECFEGVIQVKSSAGESRLGGEDYTDALADWIKTEHRWRPAEMEKFRWRQAAEQLKRRLTQEESAVISIGSKDVRVSRADFRLATAELTLRLRPVIRRAIRDANLTPKHLDAVLLVGGASRMPLVMDQLRENLELLPDTSLDPDRVVALGAAVQQALCSGNAAVNDLVLTDVCPHTLGISVSKELAPHSRRNGYYSPIIERNSIIPISRSQMYSTAREGQDVVDIWVYQGEGRMVSENHKIGEIRLEGLQDSPDLEVRFSYDMNGILEVEAKILSSGKKVTAVFVQRPGTLTQEQIDEAIRALQPLKTHPRESPPNRARLERAERLYSDLIGYARTELDHLMMRFEAALLSEEPEEIKKAGRALDVFMAPHFKDE